jgi:hypothetical protein
MHDALPRMVRRSAISGRTVGDAHGRERVKDRKGNRSWKKSPVSHGGESEVGKIPMRHGNPDSNLVVGGPVLKKTRRKTGKDAEAKQKLRGALL